jgi:hypothetical protein
MRSSPRLSLESSQELGYTGPLSSHHPKDQPNKALETKIDTCE